MKQQKPHDDGDDILAIDKYLLDEEWVNQSQLYNWYAVKTADARQAMDEAKCKLESVKAQLNLQIRQSPGEFGLDKLTEKTVECAVLLDKRHDEALKELHNARHDYDCLQGLLIALDHKKKALEKLVELQGRDYFSEPKPVGVSIEKREGVKRDSIARRGVRKKSKRRREN